MVFLRRDKKEIKNQNKKKETLFSRIFSIVATIITIGFVVYFIMFKLNFAVMMEWAPYISEGIWLTLGYALICAILGAIGGVILALMKNSNNTYLNKFVDAYVDLFRGTPLIVQLSFIYWGLPQFGITFNPNLCCILTFSLNSSAYISEIIRSGINSIDKGQIEAAKALGVSKFDIYKDIILPIAIKNILPSLINEFITLIKETSIVSIIGVPDLMRRSQIVSSQTYLYFEALMVVAVIYYVVIKIFTYFSRKVEEKLQYD